MVAPTPFAVQSHWENRWFFLVCWLAVLALVLLAMVCFTKGPLPAGGAILAHGQEERSGSLGAHVLPPGWIGPMETRMAATNHGSTTPFQQAKKPGSPKAWIGLKEAGTSTEKTPTMPGKSPDRPERRGSTHVFIPRDKANP